MSAELCASCNESAMIVSRDDMHCPNCGHVEVVCRCPACIAPAMSGRTWETTDAMIEAAAESLYVGIHSWPWDAAALHARTLYRSLARAAFTAALAVVPGGV